MIRDHDPKIPTFKAVAQSTVRGALAAVSAKCKAPKPPQQPNPDAERIKQNFGKHE